MLLTKNTAYQNSKCIDTVESLKQFSIIINHDRLSVSFARYSRLATVNVKPNAKKNNIYTHEHARCTGVGDSIHKEVSGNATHVFD